MFITALDFPCNSLSLPLLWVTFLEFLTVHLLTPWSRVLLAKLTGSQLVKKFPAFYGTRRFINVFTTACHLPLFGARSIQSMPPHLPSWRSILILSSHLCLGLPSGLFPSCFPTKTLYGHLPSPYMQHAPPISFFSTWSLEWYWQGVQVIKLLIMQFSPLPCYLSFLGPNILNTTLFSNVLRTTFLVQHERPSLTSIQNNRQSYSYGYLNLYVVR